MIKGGAPTDVAFAPHGTTVAVSGYNGVTEVLNPATRTVKSRPKPGGEYVFGVAFSPDGSKLAATGWDGTVHLFNSKTGRRIATIIDPDQDVVNSVAWSPDGHTIAITDWEGTLRIFDVTTRRQVAPAYQLGAAEGQTRNLYATFTPDGADVVVSDDTGQAWIFPITLKAWEIRACAVANRSFTHAEWNQFVPGLPYQPVCPASPGG